MVSRRGETRDWGVGEAKNLLANLKERRTHELSLKVASRKLFTIIVNFIHQFIDSCRMTVDYMDPYQSDTDPHQNTAKTKRVQSSTVVYSQ